MSASIYDIPDDAAAEAAALAGWTPGRPGNEVRSTTTTTSAAAASSPPAARSVGTLTGRRWSRGCCWRWSRRCWNLRRWR